jgi:predicted nucleic acid-binding protein
MSYLLDTNVISELVRPKPDKKVLEWFKNTPDSTLHLSVLTLGEIRKDIENIKETKKKESLKIWLEVDLREWFGNRILSIDEKIAERWGRLQFAAKRPIPAIDSLIAATALQHDLSLITRNTQDVNYPDLQVINPWK